MTPTHIQKACANLDASTLPGTLAVNGKDCEGAKFHSPSPLVVRKIDTPTGRHYLCGTCEANLCVLLTLREAGPLPWPLRREFGNKLRAVAGV